MNKKGHNERTLVIVKPDALNRSLLGEVISRFERKGLKIVGMKMVRLNDVLLEEHYARLKERPFFAGLKRYMSQSPCIVLALEGMEVVRVVRALCGPTSGREATAGTIRGDFSVSTQANIVHASDSPESANAEINRFFGADELFDYIHHGFTQIYSEEERE